MEEGIKLEKHYNPETKFNIYKIDLDLITTTPSEDGENIGGPVEKRNRLLTEIANDISSKKNVVGANHLQYGNYIGIVYKTYHEPNWKGVISFLLSNNEETTLEPNYNKEFISNTNISYVLLYVYKDALYAMTGGYGSHYVQKYIERNFGLYLIPKIISKDSAVVKRIQESNLTGLRASSQRANRSATSFRTEQDLSSIFKETNIQIDKEVASALGIAFDENTPEDKKVNIINKDSLVIRWWMTLDGLEDVLHNLYHLEKKPDKFALNYLVPARKKGYRNPGLLDALVQQFVDQHISSFILVGDDYSKYYFNADTYEVSDESQTPIIQQHEPIELKAIFDYINGLGKRLNPSFIKKVLKKWHIKVFDESGHVQMYETPIFQMLQGFMEVGERKTVVHLISGEWYVLEPNYIEALDKEYQDLYDSIQSRCANLKSDFLPTAHVSVTEDDYNLKYLINKSRITVAHTALMDNIELADAIFCDHDNVYLLHNKSKFSGLGARDLTNQILSASEYLQQKSIREKVPFLQEYYQKIKSAKKLDNQHIDISEEQFVRLFDKRICFVAGYVSNYRKESESNYAKYLTIELYQKLSARGQGFLTLSLS